MSLFFLSTILLALAILGTILTLVWTSRGNRYYLTLREQGKVSDCQATRRVQS